MIRDTDTDIRLLWTGRFWPTAEVRQDEYRGAGMRAEAAGRAIRGIISATDPKQPFVVSGFKGNTNRIESLGAIEFSLNVGAVHAISFSPHQA